MDDHENASGKALRLAICCGLLSPAVLFPRDSSAQYVPPKVEMDLAVSASTYPHLETDDVAVADCIEITRRAGAIRSEEIGTIRVMAYAPWYQTSEHLAMEKAGEAGANCLMNRFPAGMEATPFSYPFQVAYRAFRLTRQEGFGSTGYWIPIRVEAPPAPVQAPGSAVASPPNAGAPMASGQAAHEHLWTSGNFIYRYEIGMDTAKFSEETWADVMRDFKEYFPPSDYERMLRARRGKAKVLVDFKNLRIRLDP